jgi:hypothetical protein
MGLIILLSKAMSVPHRACPRGSNHDEKNDNPCPSWHAAPPCARQRYSGARNLRLHDAAEQRHSDRALDFEGVRRSLGDHPHAARPSIVYDGVERARGNHARDDNSRPKRRAANEPSNCRSPGTIFTVPRRTLGRRGPISRHLLPLYSASGLAPTHRSQPCFRTSLLRN